MNLLMSLFQSLSPSGAAGRLSILIFHRVLREADPLFPDLPDAARFGRILKWLKSWFNVLPLDQAVRRLAAEELPARAASITFDDGYVDNYLVALPLLHREGLTATFFIATGFMNGGRMWNDTIIEAVRLCNGASIDLEFMGLGRRSLETPRDRRATIDSVLDYSKYLLPNDRFALAERVAERAGALLPTDLMMTSSQIREMRRGGMQIGAHTISHPILTKISTDEARFEISQGRSWLENVLDERIALFAYPNGRLGVDYVAEHVKLVRDLGFDAAVSTNRGVATRDSDLMELPRFTPWRRSRAGFGAELAANLFEGRMRKRASAGPERCASRDGRRTGSH